VLSKIALIGKDYKVEQIGTEDLKPPYMMLSNHMHFIDFELAAMATHPHPVSNVVSIDGYVIKFFLLEWIGAIATRKFTTDLHLVKSIRKVLQRGDILAMYPEARYSPCGTTAFMPDSLGKLIKMNKVPVVAVVHHGNHLYAPFWNFRNKRKVPFYTTFKKILTPEQIAEMSVDEINALLRAELSYDEYRYQKDHGILVKEPYRAEGLHKVLYQCPHCMTESKMDSKGTELFCRECGKRWVWQEDGYLKAVEGETEFDHIPDWFHWQRQQVKKQIQEGTYRFSEEVDVYSLPRVYRYIPLGKAKLTHDPEKGFILEGHYRGQDYYINRQRAQTNSLHVEYDFGPLGKRDCLDISTENDSFYCIPKSENVITKLGFATEELYLRSQEKRK
jgi:1-acyl-sn-glycerol-3-phosphate acyltransferase/DNA-directed RNA polymerase subunit RPC12/RpoP